MPKYGDDQCEECGGIRAAGSKLCPDCLVRRLNAEKGELLIKHRIIETLEKTIKNQRGQLEDALAYGFKQNQANVELNQYIRELEKRIYEGWKDEKDGKAKDTKEG